MSILLKDGLYNQPIDHVLEDLLVRFVINVPDEDLSSIERVFFQVEEAQWFYTDFVRALNQNLPSMKMKTFAPKMLNKCPLLWKWGDPRDALARFGAYKSTIPVRGVAMLNSDLTKVVLVRGYESKSWSFPRGKISKDESDLECAIREVREETGFDCRDHVNETDVLERTIGGKNFKIFLATNVPENTKFEPLVRNEIADITWFDIKALQKAVKNNSTKYFVVNILLQPLNRWIAKNKGVVSEKELIQQAEIKLKALMGISSDVNIDAGRELLDILQGAKPTAAVQSSGSTDSAQNPQQVIQMSLPRHLQSVYGGMQMPQFFPPYAQNPGQMHMMPPPEFLQPHFGAPPPRPPVAETPRTTDPPSAASPATNGQSSSHSKDFLSILNGPRIQKDKPSTQKAESINSTPKTESLSRPDTPSKKITLLKRDASKNEAPNSFLSLLGKNPNSSGPSDTRTANSPNANASELLGILNGKASKKSADAESKKPMSPQTLAGAYQNGTSSTPHPQKDNKASGELLSILNKPKSIDNKASGELLSILNNPRAKPPKSESEAPPNNRVPSDATQHNPADLSAGNQILQFINSGSNKQTPPESCGQTQLSAASFENDDEFESYENFDDLEEQGTAEHNIYDRIKDTIDSESEEEVEPEYQEARATASSGKTNSAGAGLLQLLNGGKPPMASYGETYGTPQQAPQQAPVQSQPHPLSAPGNGADLLRLLKRGQ